MRHSIGFRSLAEDDLPLLLGWRETPEVSEWYGTKPADQLAREYVARIRAEVGIRCFLVLLSDNPVGFIQCYDLADFPDDSRKMDISGGAFWVDLFIARISDRWRGIGAAALRAFLRDVAFPSFPSARYCALDVDPANVRAMDCYASLGFEKVGSSFDHELLKPCDVLALSREKFFSSLTDGDSTLSGIL